MSMVGRIINEISYTIMLLRFMDVREKNILKQTGKNHKFCESKYIMIPIKEKGKRWLTKQETKDNLSV